MAGLAHWSEYTRFLLALIAVLDPFMAIPVFLGLRAGRTSAQQHRLARTASLAVLGVLVGAALAGDLLLRLMGTSLASFRIAGGLVLLLMALAMLHVRLGGDESGAADGTEASGVVPLAVPLLAGPGAISMVMIAVQQGGWPHRVAIIAAITAVCCLLWAMLRLAARIGGFMRPAGLNIANRLLGLLLAAIAVESMANGLKGLFPGLG